MGVRWASLRELYLTVDRRVLGALRIATGLVLLYDLVRRFPLIRLFYANTGVLSNHFVLFQPEARPQLSFLVPFSTPGEVTCAFVAIGVVYACYTLGVLTRAAQLAAFVCLTSLNARNLFVEDGGVIALIMLCLWTSFLPLGDRFSLDAVLRDARLPTLRARIAARRRLKKPVVSCAVLALLLQVVVIYVLNAAQKVGETWRDGSAVHYVLWQARIDTSFGHWLAHHEPAWFSPLASRGTVVMEALIPALLVYPFRRFTRTLGFALACALHLGIAATMSLGPFSYAMMALVLSRIPAEALVSIGERLPVALRRRVNRLRARAVALTAPYVARGRPPKPAARPLPWSKLREATVLALMAVGITELGADNPAFLLRVPQPDWLRALVLYPRITQRWTMFAPDAPKTDGIAVIDAVTADGRHLDPFTGAPPDFDALDKGPLPHPLEVSEYLFQLHFDGNLTYRRELARFIAEWHEHFGAGPYDRLVSYQAYWVSRQSPPLGSTTPGPTERRLFDGTRFTPPAPQPMLPPRPLPR
ncbi:MAG TPA: lipase maturation factor family protein [Polyangiaceae bacterium]|nr:lipase maturation factor family protein [Polyangiaceae bacterium]